LVLESGNKVAWSSVGVLGDVLVNCGIPCFVVPDTFEKPASFDSIAIASHGSPESIRAVHAALPLLQRARRITLIKGNPREAFAPVDFRPAFTIEDHLKRHGLNFATCMLDAKDDRAGHEILAAAADGYADLLVVGAYGRTRFSEWILGGVTRHVLEHGGLPLFMRH
jgi:nucleotide-binding universal stress UspA family protein